MCGGWLRRRLRFMFRPNIPHIAALAVAVALGAAAPAHAAGPDHFVLSVAPRPVKVGEPVTIRAVAKDSLGATVTGYAGTATLADNSGAVPARDVAFHRGVASVVVQYDRPVRYEVLRIT